MMIERRRELDGSLSSKSKELKARYCKIESMGCYPFGIDEAQGLYITLKFIAKLMQIVQIPADASTRL